MFRKPHIRVLRGLFILLLFAAFVFCWGKVFHWGTPVTTAMIPKIGDIVSSTYYRPDELPNGELFATIINQHTGAVSECSLHKGTELQVIGIEAGRALLLVRNTPTEVYGGSCKKNQEVLLRVEAVSQFKKHAEEIAENNTRNLATLRAIKKESTVP